MTEKMAEETCFWDFPDKQERCLRQRIWHEEQAKVYSEVEFDECGNRIPVFHGWGPERVPCVKKEFVSPPPPQPMDEPAVDFDVESLQADEVEAEAAVWNEYQLEQAPGAQYHASDTLTNYMYTVSQKTPHLSVSYKFFPFFWGGGGPRIQIH